MSMILITTVLKDGQIRLPSFLVARLGLEDGDVVELDLGEVKKIGHKKSKREEHSNAGV